MRYELINARTSPLNRIFDTLFTEPMPAFQQPWAAFRAKETEEGYVVEAELAGVKKEDLKIELLGDTLKVSGHRGSKDSDKNGYCDYSEFSKSFSLGEDIDADSVEAKYENGYLTLKLLRSTKTAKSKFIEIK